MFFSDPLILFWFGLVAAIIFTCVAAARYIARRERERKRREEAFVNSLISAFGNHALATVDDVINLHHAAYPSASSPVRVYRHVNYLLEIMQLRISSATQNTAERALLARLGDLRALRAAAADLLATEERRVPFYGTPEPERAVLEDILELTAADREIVGSKLTRLAELVTAREDTLRKLGEEKGHARRLAAWGLAGTVVFGVVSLVLSLTRR